MWGVSGTGVCFGFDNASATYAQHRLLEPKKLLNMPDLLSPGLTAQTPNQVELSAPKVMIPPEFESENYPSQVFEIWAI